MVVSPYRETPQARVVREIVAWMRECANNTDPSIPPNDVLIRSARLTADAIERRWGEVAVASTDGIDSL